MSDNNQRKLDSVQISKRLDGDEVIVEIRIKPYIYNWDNDDEKLDFSKKEMFSLSQ